MGKIEEKVRKRFKRNQLRKIIIGAVAAAGVLSVGMFAPSVIGVLAKLGIINTSRRREVINRARERLIKAGLLAQNERGYLIVTEKGEITLWHLEVVDYKMKKPKYWDKKWRILIFDISEKRKLLRDKVRRALQSIGFIRLQSLFKI